MSGTPVDVNVYLLTIEVFSIPCGHVRRNVGVSRGSQEDNGRSWKDFRVVPDYNKDHATG